MSLCSVILNNLNDFNLALGSDLPLKERVLLGYIQEVKKTLEGILHSEDSETVIEERLVASLKSWDFPRMYTSYPNSEIVTLVCDLAEALCERHNASLGEDERPWTSLELLMPHVHLESNDTDYPHLMAFEAPQWTQGKEHELSQLKKELNSSDLPTQEEELELSEEEDRQFQDYINCKKLLERYKHSNPEREKELQSRIHELQGDETFQSALKKEEQGKRIRRIHLLGQEHLVHLGVEKHLATGQVKLQGHYVVPVLNLKDLLSTHILSAQADALIPVSVVLKNPLPRPYQDTSEAELTSSEEYTQEELVRLKAHSSASEALFNAEQRLELIKNDKSNLLGHLNHLCKYLRLYDAKEGTGKEDNAGNGAYEPIRSFADYYETLGYQLRKYPQDLQHLVEGFVYYDLSFDELTHAFTLSYTIKSGEELITGMLDKDTLPQLTAKIDKRIDHNKELKANGKQENAITAALVFEDLRDLKEEVLAITHARKHTTKENEERNKIPLPLRKEIELLLNLSQNDTLNLNATANVQTCIATRRGALEQTMKGQEELLATIACSEQQKVALLREAMDGVTNAHNSLEAMLKTKTYAGEDKFPLSKELLKRLNISLEFNSPLDLKALMELSAEEINALASKDGGNKPLAQLISSLEDLVLFIHEYPTAKVDAFLNCTQPHLLKRLYNTNRDAKALLSSLEGDKLSLITKALYTHKGAPQLLLFTLVEDTPQLKEMLSLIPKKQRMNAVKEKNKYGNTLLHIAARYSSESLQMILELYPQEQRLEAVKEKNQYEDTALHYTVYYNKPESLKRILELYPQEQRLDTVKEKNKHENAMLHLAAYYSPESLKMILELYPKEQRGEAVKEKNKDENTVLHLAASHPGSLKMILELYPQEQRVEAVKEKNKDENTVLHHAAPYPESLKMILDSLPQEQRLEAVKEKNYDGNNALHEANDNPESLKTILDSLPQEQRLVAIIEKNEEGNTVLHKAVYNAKSLKMILEIYPQEQRMEAVKEKNQDGDTVLDLAKKNPILLYHIFQSLPATCLTEQDVVEDIKRYLPYKDNKKFIDGLYLNLLDTSLTALNQNQANNLDNLGLTFFKPTDMLTTSKMSKLKEAVECFKESIINNTSLATEHLEVLHKGEIGKVLHAYVQFTEKNYLLEPNKGHLQLDIRQNV